MSEKERKERPKELQDAGWFSWGSQKLQKHPNTESELIANVLKGLDVVDITRRFTQTFEEKSPPPKKDPIEQAYAEATRLFGLGVTAWDALVENEAFQLITGKRVGQGEEAEKIFTDTAKGFWILALEKLDAINLSSSSLSKEMLSRIHNKRGDILLRLGKAAEALKEYDAAVKELPNNYYAHRGRGKALAAQKESKPEDIARAFQLAVWHDPIGYIGLLELCVMGKFAGPEAYFKQAAPGSEHEMAVYSPGQGVGAGGVKAESKQEVGLWNGNLASKISISDKTDLAHLWNRLCDISEPSWRHAKKLEFLNLVREAALKPQGATLSAQRLFAWLETADFEQDKGAEFSRAYYDLTWHCWANGSSMTKATFTKKGYRPDPLRPEDLLMRLAAGITFDSSTQVIPRGATKAVDPKDALTELLLSDAVPLSIRRHCLNLIFPVKTDNPLSKLFREAQSAFGWTPSMHKPNTRLGRLYKAWLDLPKLEAKSQVSPAPDN